MRLQLYSDLHNEFRIQDFQIPKLDSDLIVLAGDIGKKIKAMEYAIDVMKKHGKPLIFVPGNHEYYGTDFTILNDKFAELAAQYEQLHYLNRDELIIGDVRFLGTTLWTNYFHEDGVVERQKNQMILDDMLNDHRVIRIDGERFGTTQAYNENQKCERWLRGKLDEKFDGKTVVISHHAPSTACNHREFGMNQASPGFVSNYHSLLKKANFWLYGHTHSNEDMTICGCRVISNQTGYQGQGDMREAVAGNEFAPDLVIEIT
jgi:predicted phosphodiesterase